MKFGIGAKVATLCIVLVALSAGTVGYVSYRNNKSTLEAQQWQNLKEDVCQGAIQLHNALDGPQQDLRFLAEERTIRFIINPSERWWKDFKDNDYKCFLARRFGFVRKNKPAYLQLRLISADGKEIVWFKHGVNDQAGPQQLLALAGFPYAAFPASFPWAMHLIHIMPPPREVQTPGLMDWLHQTAQLHPDEVSQSAVERLSEEPGAVDARPVYVIRFAKAIIVQSPEGRPDVWGFLVIDVDFEQYSNLVEKYQVLADRQSGQNPEAESDQLSSEKWIFTNSKGSILLPADLDKQFGGALAGGTWKRLQDIWPNLEGALKETNGNRPTKLDPHLGGSGLAGYFMRVNPEDPEEDLGLAVVTRHESLVADVNAAGNRSALLTIGFILGAATLALLFAQILTRPLKKITFAAHNLAHGQFTDSLPVDHGGEIGVLARAFRDMTEQVRKRGHELHEREARIRAIVDNASEGIITSDDKGHITTFNLAAERIFGYKAEEVVGRSLTIFMPPSRLEEIGGDFESYVESGVYKKVIGCTREAVGRRKDGTSFAMEVSDNEVIMGDTRIFTAIVRDITERKQAERQIRQLNEDLERRVVDRTAALQKANAELGVARDQALEANQTKSAFLAQMSHELRTPLNAIIGYSELLQEEVEERQQLDLVPDLKKIMGAGRHLLELINDILDLSKIEAKKVDLYLENFEIRPIIEEVASTVNPLLQRNGNTLELSCADDLDTMYADRTRLRQVLFNLLSNACKFTDKGNITLTAVREKAEGSDHIVLHVKDSGIGMTPEQMHKLFQPFTQADASTTRKYGGTGLGLTISRRLCQMMGGDIAVASEFGQGSVFTVHLPARVVKVEAPPAPTVGYAVAPAAADAITVLAIDDDPAVREMMHRFLAREGFRVVTAASGEEGLRAARETRPQVITLDVMMPNMDGWAVLSALKAEPDLAEIPVIMLTIVDDKNLGYALGAADYLTKPLDRNRLISVLKKHCRSSANVALVVEDDPASREMLRRLLEKDGWSVIEAANGIAALHCVAHQQPSLILLDLMMPEMDGFEFLGELRQHPEWRSIPVVVVTAKELTPEDRVFLNSSLMLSGCVKRVLQKGTFNRDDLLREVRDLVKSHTGEATPNGLPASEVANTP